MGHIYSHVKFHIVLYKSIEDEDTIQHRIFLQYVLFYVYILILLS